MLKMKIDVSFGLFADFLVWFLQVDFVELNNQSFSDFADKIDKIWIIYSTSRKTIELPINLRVGRK